MATWAEFEAAMPEMAAGGRKLIYQYGPGLGFLATVRRDGAPRLHPICLNLVEGGLFGLIVESPKLGDLRRDGRFALHAMPPEQVDDEFMVSGQAAEVRDAATVAAVVAAQHAAGATTEGGEVCFEFLIDRALLSIYKARGDWPPVYTRWQEGK